MAEQTLDQRRQIERRFVYYFALAAAFVAAIPALVAWMGTPVGGSYLGIQYNTDDHMVYSAWMRQGMDFHLLMDNRFTTDSQPGLTIHLYFFVLGLFAKILGIPLAFTLARVILSYAFVLLLYRLIRRLEWSIYATKLAIALSVLGGGLGFLVWHMFGQLIVRDAPSLLSGPMLGRLPTDVWQPEGFVFPSMLTNGLFMVSLCLIMITFVAFLDARDNRSPLWMGVVALGVLMNIHSYDVLLVGLAMLGFAAAALAQGQLTAVWTRRALGVLLGGLPAALWFVYVLKNDPVFQARAATETFSPNFRAVFFGYAPLILLAMGGMFVRAKGRGPKPLIGVGLASGLIAGLFALASNHQDGYFLGFPGWGACFIVSVAAVVLMAEEKPAVNLITSWALVGLVAIYFPGLFQRKLAMGLAIPWAILAAVGIEAILAKQERSSRNLATVLFLIIMSATSGRWLMREIELIKANVSNTTVHPVYLNPDARHIVAYLNDIPGKKVVVSLPGQPTPLADSQTGKAAVDSFGSPLIPDLNPILSGLTGAYTVAGHWSETPKYGEKRNEVTAIFVSNEADTDKLAKLRTMGVNYLVAPVPEAFPEIQLPDLRRLGTVVVEGGQFSLVELPK